jgi:uncharacterized cupin superfamily protein
LVLEGEIEVTFRGETSTLRTGDTANIPANAPHCFRNTADRAARLLCTCAPPGLEEFFLAVGDRVNTRKSPPPDLDNDTNAARMAKAAARLSRAWWCSCTFDAVGPRSGP